MDIIKFENANFFKVNAFATHELCEYLAFYSLHLYNAGRLKKGDSQSPISDLLVGIPIYEALLDFKTPLMESLCHCNLFPTYSYGRIYKNGSILEEHRDRPACEFSVSLTIGSSQGFEWPIFMYDNTDKKHYISLETGDAVVYKGCESTHGRDPLVCKEDEYLIQLFMHYVNSDGPYANQKYDGKAFLNY